MLGTVGLYSYPAKMENNDLFSKFYSVVTIVISISDFNVYSSFHF